MNRAYWRQPKNQWAKIPLSIGQKRGAPRPAMRPYTPQSNENYELRLSKMPGATVHNRQILNVKIIYLSNSPIPEIWRALYSHRCDEDCS